MSDMYIFSFGGTKDQSKLLALIVIKLIPQGGFFSLMLVDAQTWTICSPLD